MDMPVLKLGMVQMPCDFLLERDISPNEPVMSGFNPRILHQFSEVSRS